MVQNAGFGVGGVALCCDLFVPIVVGIGRILELNRLKPGILTRWLVEMTVDANRTLHIHSSIPRD